MSSDGASRASTWTTDAPGNPDVDALRATRAAAAIARELRAGGRELRFALVPAPERVRVELCDDSGTVLAHMTARAMLDIATGITSPGELQ